MGKRKAFADVLVRYGAYAPKPARKPLREVVETDALQNA